MLVFGTQMHIVTFFFVSVEIVILLYLAIFRFARPNDKTTCLNLILITLLLTYNVSGGLLPDPKLPGSYSTQVIIAYATGFITPCYFPYYVYKAFSLTKLKFHAYKGVYLFLIFPFCIFVLLFLLSGDLKATQDLLIIPLLYAVWVTISLIRAINYKYHNSFAGVEAKQEMIVLLLCLTPWIGLPIITYFDFSQDIEALAANVGFLLLFGLQVNRQLTTLRCEHRRLIQSEQRLTSYNENLRDEVSKRTKELEKINEQKTNNFINLVHETKTPLTLIKNYLDEYIRKNGSVEELDIIKGGVDKLTADVINLFDLERFSRGIDTYKHNKASDFSQILHDSLPLFRFYCLKQEINCSTNIEDNIFIKADPNAIYRIVNNIIENAIKFSEAGGKISISLTTEQNRIIFSVSDTGSGIPKELQKKVFEPYYQIGYKNTSLQGMGLGLPIVKKVVNNLDGAITIYSDPPQILGTKIIVDLPQYNLVNGDISVKETDGLTKLNYNIPVDKLSDGEFNKNRQTILLVEDSVAMLNFIANKLRTFYNVFCARNGSDALKQLSNMPVLPDLILSDIMMDKMDGFALMKHLSKQIKYNHIPVILLTAKSTSADRLKGLKLGALDFISKPFSFEELSLKIESILNNVLNHQRALIDTTILTLRMNKNDELDGDTATTSSKFEQNSKNFSLTAREVEIVRLIAKGETYKDIAKNLYISEKTVTKHIQNLFEKVEVNNKIQLINKLYQ